jgi:LCP family protein required for cell wall assembly
MPDTTSPERSEKQMIKLSSETRTVLKGTLIGLVSLFLSLVMVLLSAYFILKPKYDQFLAAADLSHNQFISLIRQAYHQEQSPILGQDHHLTFMVLGIDSLAQRTGSPPLTDTLLLAQLDLNETEITTISLPRDLWSEAYQTKINALYTYGFDRYPGNPEKFPEMVVEKWAQHEIDQTIIISLEQLGQLIDLVGGIEIEVKQGFSDPKFPRTDVDVTQVSDPDKLYETVEFEPGKQTMSGERALKYIRSRHSQDDAGTDLARNSRQQQVINALITRLSQAKLYWQQPVLAGKLLNYYQQNFDQYFKTSDLMTIGFKLGPNLTQLKFEAHTLPVYPDNEDGIIVHPEPSPEYQDQWIYLLKDKDEFANYIQDKLD